MSQLIKRKRELFTSRRISVSELFEGDHEAVLDKLEDLQKVLMHLRYEGKASLGKNLNGAYGVLKFFEHELIQHIKLEDEILFPFLEEHIPKLELALHLLKAEHEDFKLTLKSFKFWLRELKKEGANSNRIKIVGKIDEHGTYLIYLLRNHIRAECESVYKVIDCELRLNEKKELTKRIKCKNEVA